MAEEDTQAARLHKDAIVIDGCSFFSKGWHERLEVSGVTALQMTVPWPWDDARTAIRRYSEYYAIVRDEPRLNIVLTADDIKRNKAEGRVGFILGCQNAQILEDDPSLVEVFARLGVRVIQLAYNSRNLLADGCLESNDAGLSRLGRTMIQEMNRHGIQVDLSHTGERSSREAIELSEKPCIISHANPRTRSENPRNISDDLIKACAEAGGVIGVTPYAPINWTGGDAPPTLQDVVDHAEYLADLVGAEHISFGTDSEATPGAYPAAVTNHLSSSFPEPTASFRAKHPGLRKTVGFESMENLPEFTAALLARGWSEDDVRGVLGLNLLRVYGQNWGAA
ncbi:MAG: dipeptidase [Thermomicrobiales bacterium]|nr:dipeptidase [Thermomicrobiales bacterium]